jgi:hypothetical protein
LTIGTEPSSYSIVVSAFVLRLPSIMGRVARYKKVKSFDPYSKKNNGRIDLEKVGIWGLGGDTRKAKKVSKTVEKIRARKNNSKNKLGTKRGEGRRGDPNAQVLDAEYGEDDFDLSDMVGSLKKEAPPAVEPAAASALPVPSPAPRNLASSAKSSSSTAAEASASTKPAHDAITSPEVEEERLLRRLKLDKPAPAPSASQSTARMPGESKEAYKRRSALEVRRIIRQNRMEQLNPEKRQRKKEFLNNKKKRNKGGSGGSQQQPASSRWSAQGDEDDDGGRRRYDDEGDDDVSLSDRRTETRVVFGEQVEAPPVFRQRPRGVDAPKAAAADAGKNSAKRRLATPQDIDSEQEAMEQIRRKAQAHYSLIKARRRQDGEFHL